MSDYLDSVLLVGCGYMGQEYCKVLKALQVSLFVVGRGESSAKDFRKKTGIMAYTGGLAQFIDKQKLIPPCAIVAVNMEELYGTVKQLLDVGVKRILVEKPGAICYEQIQKLSALAERRGADVFVAYNRRFYSSVRKAMELIAEDGGVSSFRFEFTEWTHKILALNKSSALLGALFLGNSSHVVDLAFYLGGIPKSISCYTAGAFEWYDKASSFSGAGIAQNGASFSYYADWESAGRWSVEILTKKRKLLLCPLEELRSQLRGSLTAGKVEIDDELDQKFKPGLYLQTKTFLDGSCGSLLTLREHVKLCEFYQKIEAGSGS